MANNNSRAQSGGDRKRERRPGQVHRNPGNFANDPKRAAEAGRKGGSR